MGAVRVPPPDPDSPSGMAFVLSGGMVDPRLGKTLENDRMPVMLIQGWEAQSKFWWDLGLRYHPDLAVKHLKGGGQFQVAQIVDGPPPPPEPEMSTEEAARKILDIIAENNPAFANTIRNVAEKGSEAEKAELRKKLESEKQGIQNLADYIQGNL